MTINLCHDEFTVYYPQAPGRVYSISFTALAASADSHDLGTHWQGATGEDDVGVLTGRNLAPLGARPTSAPLGWPGATSHPEDAHLDLADALEEWMDWCDKDGERQDAFDGVAPTSRAA